MPIANVRAALSAGAAPSFNDLQVLSNPLGLWLMDETSGAEFVDSGSVGQNGDWSASYPPGLGTATVFGLPAAEFIRDGGGRFDYGTLPLTGLTGSMAGASGVATWEWLYRQDNNAYAASYIWKHDTGTVATFYIQNTGQIVAKMYDATNAAYHMDATTGTGEIVVGTDYHIVATYDLSAPRFEIWVNGVSVSVATTATASHEVRTSTGQASMGATTASATNGQEGAMSSVALYPAVLSDATIADHYAALS